MYRTLNHVLYDGGALEGLEGGGGDDEIVDLKKRPVFRTAQRSKVGGGGAGDGMLLKNTPKVI